MLIQQAPDSGHVMRPIIASCLEKNQQRCDHACVRQQKSGVWWQECDNVRQVGWRRLETVAKMTSTGSACSLNERAYIVCAIRQKEMEGSKRQRSVSGRRSNGTVSTFCTMKKTSRFAEAKATYLPDHNTQPFSSSHTSPR